MRTWPLPRETSRGRCKLYEGSMSSRFWLGIALLVILVGAFWCVDYVAERLIVKSMNERARDLVGSILTKLHWEVWETDSMKKEFLREHVLAMSDQPYQARLIGLPDDPRPPAVPKADDGREPSLIYLPEEGWEAEEIPKLRDEWRAQMEALQLAPLPDGAPKLVPRDRESELVPRSRWRHIDSAEPSQDEYHYYQPVYWKESCIRCHHELVGADRPASAEPLFRVVKVAMPYRETQATIHWVRATIASIGFVTFTLALLALRLFRGTSAPQGSEEAPR